MKLNLTWHAPTPLPTCGFKIQYRRKADATYTEIDLSGSTVSGSTISVAAPACYEGTIQNNCCSDSLSADALFGVNAYSPLTVSITSRTNDYLVVMTSLYASPYATLITGTFKDSHHGQVPISFTVTYPAGVTTATVNAGVTGYGGTISALNISAVSPVFDNGGQLQQLDLVSTPSYFKLYWTGDVSGTTWTNGSPAALPSFTIDAFNATEIDTNGNVLQGDLLISYILGYAYSDAITSLVFEVYHEVVLLGTMYSLTTPFGLREETISLVSTSDINRNTAYTLQIYTPALVLIDTKTFYLP